MESLDRSKAFFNSWLLLGIAVAFFLAAGILNLKTQKPELDLSMQERAINVNKDLLVFLQNGKLAYDGSVSSLMKQGPSQDFILTVHDPGDIPSRFQIMNKLELSDKLVRFTVNETVKDPLLSHFISTGRSVVSLEMVKPSLEEIFYKTKSGS